MSEDKKRYIVTYKEPEVSFNEAAKILEKPRKDIKDGVLELMTEKPLEEIDIYHFEEIGSTTVTLSEEEASNLDHDDRVQEVVEDFELYALEDCDCGEEYNQGQESEEASDSSEYDFYAEGYQQAFTDIYGTQDVEGSENDLYEAGYQQALADFYEEWGAQRSPYFRRPYSPRPSFPSPLRPSFPSPYRPPIFRPPLPSRPIFPPPFPSRPFPPPYIPPSPTPGRKPPTSRQAIPWNIQLVKANRIWNRVTGRGVKVGVIDSGIDGNHPDLRVSGGVSFVPRVGSWQDDQGHGTHCAGIIGARNNRLGLIGVAPNCSLYAIKVLSNNGRGNLSWILAGMGWAAQKQMDVVSMSLGTDVTKPDEQCKVAFQRAAQKLIDKECIVIAASGNSGKKSNHWVGQPARCPGVMAVASVDRNCRRSSFSSYGPGNLVEICAPGGQVKSTFLRGRYKEMSGTSMACPHVAGAAALLKELHPTWSPAQIRARLNSTTRDLGAPKDDPYYGSGLLDCYSAIFG